MAEISDAVELLKRLTARGGGAIVSSGICSELEIADARARGDFYVDPHGFGFVLRLKAWTDRIHERDGCMQPPEKLDPALLNKLSLDRARKLLGKKGDPAMSAGCEPAPRPSCRLCHRWLDGPFDGPCNHPSCPAGSRA